MFKPNLPAVLACVAALLVGVPAATAATVAPQSAASADQSVDPSTLNPPVPAEFNPVCKAVGAGTICDVAFTEPSFSGEPTGIQCAGPAPFEVLLSGTRSVTGKRYYDRNGDLTERHFRDEILGILTNPLTGATLSWYERNRIDHLLGTPGDPGTGTETLTNRLRIAGTDGTVLIDAGRTVQDAADGTVLFEAGQHPFFEYFEHGDATALQPICEALS